MASYNKKEHLRANIEAIKTVFALHREQRTATPEERTILEAYTGFGALKCILSPANTMEDIARWNKSECPQEEEMMQDGEKTREEMERSPPIEQTVTAPFVSTSAAQTDRPLESNGQSISATQPAMDGLPPSLAEKVFVVRPKF